ncbi:MAG TPA: T9SS type A sorting domain-containing protein, partial [Cyclobacteriaceae bacterium]|nr:T9SS type A sorting domain-containing protein [Cyclobacteriaceae bacterium]
IFFKNFLTGSKEEGTGNYEYLPLAQQVISGVNESFVAARFGQLNCYPNPAKDVVTFSFLMNNTNQVQLDLLDSKGNVVNNILNEQREEGKQEVQTSVAELSPGLYFYQLKTGFVKETKKLIVAR